MTLHIFRVKNLCRGDWKS